jgi:hypothetical protein
VVAELLLFASVFAAGPPVVLELEVAAVGLEVRAERSLVAHLEDELALVGARAATRTDRPQARLSLRATRVGPLLRADFALVEPDGRVTRETRNARVDAAITSTLIGPDVASRLREIQHERAFSNQSASTPTVPQQGARQADTGEVDEPAADASALSSMDTPSVEPEVTTIEDESDSVLPTLLTIGGAGVATVGALALAVGGGAAAHEVGTIDDATALRADKDRALALTPVALSVAAVGGALLLGGSAAAGVGALGL